MKIDIASKLATDDTDGAKRSFINQLNESKVSFETSNSLDVPPQLYEDKKQDLSEYLYMNTDQASVVG